MRGKNQVLNPFTLSIILKQQGSDMQYSYITYRVSQHGQRIFVRSGHSIEPIHWDKVKGKVNAKHPNHKYINGDLAQTIGNVEAQIAKATANGKRLTIDDVRKFFGKAPSDIGAVKVLAFWGQLINQLSKENKLGTANVNKNAFNRLVKFLSTYNRAKPIQAPVKPTTDKVLSKEDRDEMRSRYEEMRRNWVTGSDIPFEKINYALLRDYETHLREANLKENSIAIHYRTLRSMYNEAMRREIVDKEHYPFDKFKVSKFNTETHPRAIPKDAIKAIERLNLPRESFLYDARNFFLFSYYGCGINFVDLAKLRWTDLEGDVITYTRQKTGKVIKIQVRDILQPILDWYQVFTGRHPEAYIFPILDHTKHITPSQINNRIDKVDKRVNKALRELSAQAGLTNKVTYYTARHTFANELQLAGVPVSKIAALLGHDERVTKVYLGKLNDSDKFSVLHHLL
jgi:site-specific recombinase XerD